MTNAAPNLTLTPIADAVARKFPMLSAFLALVNSADPDQRFTPDEVRELGLAAVEEVLGVTNALPKPLPKRTGLEHANVAWDAANNRPLTLGEVVDEAEREGAAKAPSPTRGGTTDGGNRLKAVFTVEDWVRFFSYDDPKTIDKLGLRYDLKPRMLTSARAKCLQGKYPETKKAPQIIQDIRDGYTPAEVAARNRIYPESAQHYENLVRAEAVLIRLKAEGQNVKVPVLP